MKLTDAQWTILPPLMPQMPRRADGRGRPARAAREVLDGVLWILRTGARWQDLPKEDPPYQTCHRRFQEWSRDGTFDNLVEALAPDLHERGGIDISETFIDGTFASAKKGGFA